MVHKAHFDAQLASVVVECLGSALASCGPSAMTLFANDYQGGQVFEVFSPQVAAWLIISSAIHSSWHGCDFERSG